MFIPGELLIIWIICGGIFIAGWSPLFITTLRTLPVPSPGTNICMIILSLGRLGSASVTSYQKYVVPSCGSLPTTAIRIVLPLVCPPVQLYVAQVPTVKEWFSTWLQMRCLSAACDAVVPGSTALATMTRREVTRELIMKRLREAGGRHHESGNYTFRGSLRPWRNWQTRQP